MTGPDASRRPVRGVGREVAAGLEVVARDWLGRLAAFTGVLLVIVAAFRVEAAVPTRTVGVVVGLVVVAAVFVGWWRKAPGVVQWTVAVAGVVLTVALLVLVGRA